MSDFWKFFLGVCCAMLVYGVSYVGMKYFMGWNVFLAGFLSGGFAALTFWGAGHFLGYRHPDGPEDTQQ